LVMVTMVTDHQSRYASGLRAEPGWTAKLIRMTGSVRNTRLDSLLMEAAMTCEFTTRPRPPAPCSTSVFTVAFSVDRKQPRFLYSTNTTFT
uniref:Uncharacterized protein n=1 Tax=Paramormyrops kingsleyae TaxID=1676925 RepID=A0A3B3QGI6_9TELE